MKFDFFRNYDQNFYLQLFFLLIQLVGLFIIGLFSLYLLLELGENISEQSFIVEIDDNILSLINQGEHESFEKFMVFITHLASWKTILTVTSPLFIYLTIKRYYYIAVELVLITFGSIIANVVLKNIFNRPRPEGKHIVEVISSSFPSGHSMVGFAVYGFIICIFWMISSNKSIKFIISSLFLILILLIGFSRVYLKVHYPSDVIGGYAAGLFWLVFCIGIVHLSRFLIKWIRNSHELH